MPRDTKYTEKWGLWSKYIFELLIFFFFILNYFKGFEQWQHKGEYNYLVIIVEMHHIGVLCVVRLNFSYEIVQRSGFFSPQIQSQT